MHNVPLVSMGVADLPPHLTCLYYVCVPLQVQIGAMQVDLGTLVWERRVAMRNVPLGGVQIHLSGKDMGNFVSHPLFKQAADTAVQVRRMCMGPCGVGFQDQGCLRRLKPPLTSKHTCCHRATTH